MAESKEIRTSDSEWFSSLAAAYKDRRAVQLIDDARLGVNPLVQTLLQMARETALPVAQVTAALVALGIGVAGIGMVLAAIYDPEPISKLGLMVGGGIFMACTGGFTAIGILIGQRPPKVSMGPGGFEISW